MAYMDYQGFINKLKRDCDLIPSIHEEFPRLLLSEFHKGLYEKLSPGETYLFKTLLASGLYERLLTAYYEFGRPISTTEEEFKEGLLEYVVDRFAKVDEALRAWEIFPYGDKIGCGVLFHAMKERYAGSHARLTKWEIKRRKRILESVFLNLVSSFGLSKRRFRMKIETGKVDIRPIHTDWVDHFPRGMVVAPATIIDCEGIKFGRNVIKRKLK